MKAPTVNEDHRPPLLIFIHGSWHWGGCFQHVANELTLMGFRTASPDLTSHGYDDTPIDQIGDMSGYVEPIEKFIRQSEQPVVLIGHSMGGVSVSYLAQRHPERISKAFYIAGFMTPNGSSANDYLAGLVSAPDMADFSKILRPVPGGRALDLSAIEAIRSVFYHDCKEADVAVALKNLSPTTSFIPDTLVPELTADRFGSVSRVYIECTDDRAIPIRAQRQMISDVPGAKIETMTTSHSPFFSKPKALAKIISKNL